MPPVSQISNSNSGLGAHWRGLPRFGRRGFYRTLRINLAFAELARWHFKCPPPTFYVSTSRSMICTHLILIFKSSGEVTRDEIL
jgi:hypothetical protein